MIVSIQTVQQVAQTKRWRKFTKINEDQQSTNLGIAGKLGLKYGTCRQTIAVNMNMQHISGKLVPWLFTLTGRGKDDLWLIKYG
jgi:hypothetical protein